jgi:hypothetical protein
VTGKSLRFVNCNATRGRRFRDGGDEFFENIGFPTLKRILEIRLYKAERKSTYFLEPKVV